MEEIKLQSPVGAIEVAEEGPEEEAATGALRNGAAAVEGEAVELLLEGAATFFTRKAGAAFFASKLGTMTKSL